MADTPTPQDRGQYVDAIPNRRSARAEEWLRSAIRTLYYNPEGLPKGSFIDGKTGIEYDGARFAADSTTFHVRCTRPLEPGSEDDVMFRKTLRYAVYGMGERIPEADIEVTAQNSTQYDITVRGAALASLKDHLRGQGTEKSR